MKKLSLLFVLLLIIPAQIAFAEEIVMSVDQSEYYFKIGENAVIPLDIENSYGHQISGMLQYTITQQIRQANTQFSSSNTQASTFVINDGKQTVSLDFGTSDSSSTITVNLNFNYNDDEDKQMSVSFDPITIHFVADESQKNNVQNKMQSSSQQVQSNQNKPSNPQQSIQQRLDELMNQQTSFQGQDPQQRLQNNQMAQDSSTLKKEIQEQLQKENNLKKEFEKQLASNEDFQKMHQQTIQQGYNATSGNLNPSSTSSGDFEINYENQQGQWAKIQGSMVNGTITDIQKQTQKQRDNLLAKLRENSLFQEYENQLTKEGFAESNLEFLYDKNMTSVSLEYQDEKIRTATIRADFENDDLVKIHLDKPRDDYSGLVVLFIIISAASIAGYLLYRKWKANKEIPVRTPPIQNAQPKKFDHVQAAENLIKEATGDFNEGQHKEAYAKISQALRLFLSYELKLNKEITNEDILAHLENTEYPINSIERCFGLSSLVEFAKHIPDEGEFGKMIALAEDVIKKRPHKVKEEKSGRH